MSMIAEGVAQQALTSQIMAMQEAWQALQTLAYAKRGSNSAFPISAFVEPLLLTRHL